MTLLITQAKPNPTGKDRVSRILTPPIQLAGEWIDITNIGSKAVSLNNIVVNHRAYKIGGVAEWKFVLAFSGTLGPREIVRVHSGKQIPESQMHYEDRAGAHHHVFTGLDYVWNNDKPDTPALWNTVSEIWVDKASYDAYPLEGKILTRIGDKLV